MRKLYNKFDPNNCLVFYKLPTDTVLARSQAKRFIKRLKNFVFGPNLSRNGKGFTLISMKSPTQIEEVLLPVLPPDSELSIIGLTDAQRQYTRNFYGRMRKSSSDVLECGIKE